MQSGTRCRRDLPGRARPYLVDAYERRRRRLHCPLHHLGEQEMTVEELAREVAKYIARGCGQYQVNVFQWEHQSEPVTELTLREGADLLELYSGTIPTIEKPPVEVDDLVGFDDLDDLI